MMYFSYDYPITLHTQKQKEIANELASKPLWQTADRRFFWNRYLLRLFIENGKYYLYL